MYRNIIIMLLLFAFLSSCKQVRHKHSNAKAILTPLVIEADQIEVEGDTGPFDYSFETKEISEGLSVIIFKITSVVPAQPPELTLKWSFPMVQIDAFWTSNIDVDKVTFWSSAVTSRASSQVPLICFLDNADQNRFMFALSDALNKVRSGFYLREEDARIHCSVKLFTEPTPDLTEYRIELRFDSRNISFYRAIDDAVDWWAAMDNYLPAQVPEQARLPMYSTWYSFHQNLNVAEVIRECRLGKEIGLESVIVDDGWQTMDSKRGYAFTGDWKPERIGNMKAFVDSIHNIGMKFLLWYSLPFIGEKSGSFDTFKGKYLHHWESQGTWVLDPRYPDVREHIIETYEYALRDWGLDGFKLDFLGRFYADDKTILTAENGRDYASVNEAVDRLMTDIMERLRAIRPDIMIEFRQPYIGPLMRKYGNMFRAADCPDMAVVNRVRTTDLRITSGNTAVHSDMFMWHKEDPVESAALQILNILFSVPQLSVRLDSIPADHLLMARHWISYWKENRNILLDGKFIPTHPGALYPLIMAYDENKLIAGLYSEVVVSPTAEDLQVIDIVNAKQSQEVIIDMPCNMGKAKISIFNCLGELIEQYSKWIGPGVHKFYVPPSGLLRIAK